MLLEIHIQCENKSYSKSVEVSLRSIISKRGNLSRSIKNVRVSFSIDGQYGGLVYSQSHHKMTEQGKLKHTLYGRDSEDGKLVGDGVIANGDGTYSPNTTRVLVSQYYADYYRRANVETNSFDVTFIKLREARVEYNFPSSITKKLKLNSLAVALFGRNLWMWTKEYPLFDRSKQNGCE